MITDVYAFFAKGGWLMIPILLCSVTALGFFLERLWQLRRSKILPEAFLERVFAALEAGDLERAAGLCEGSSSPLAPMIEAAIGRAGDPRGVIKEIVEEEGQRELFYLERFTGALGAIATIAPLLGLLGTVVGMIDVFQDVVAQSSAQGQVQAAALASGIWQALITTASGLAVGIPVYLAYRYLVGRIDEYAVELEERALEAVDCVAGSDAPPAPDEESASAPAHREATGEPEEETEAPGADASDETDGSPEAESGEVGREEVA